VEVASQPDFYQVCHSKESIRSARQPVGSDSEPSIREEQESDGHSEQMQMQGCVAAHMIPDGMTMHAGVTQADVENFAVMAAGIDSSNRTLGGEGMDQLSSMRSRLQQGANCQRRQVAHTDPVPWEAGVVTVMVRQIPRRCTQIMFLNELLRSGFEGQFDFLYFPYDAKKECIVGYGFINFVSHAHAQKFRRMFDGSFFDEQEARQCGKPLRVHPASTQGYEANFKQFRQTRPGKKQDPQFSPLFWPQESAPEALQTQREMAMAEWQAMAIDSLTGLTSKNHKKDQDLEAGRTPATDAERAPRPAEMADNAGSGSSSTENEELSQLRKEIVARMAELNVEEGMTSGQQRGGSQMLEWSDRMNELLQLVARMKTLKENERPASTAKPDKEQGSKNLLKSDFEE